VRATIESYRRTALAAQWDDWGMTLAPDVVYMVPNQPPLRGRAAAVKFGKSFPRLTQLRITADVVDGQGTLAFDHGSYAYNAESTPGTVVSDSGSHVDVFRKQPDGSWLLAHVIWHSDSPPSVAPLSEKKD
jgi:ketosteroid isomerase-like protein